MIRRAAVTAVIAFAAASSFADDSDKPPVPPAADPAPPAAPAADVAPVRGVRYKITMKTGRSFVGVVPGTNVFERRDGVGWTKAEKETPGAGIRLYFPRNQEGFVFVSARDIRNAERLADLTDQEGREMAQQHTVAARRASDERGQLKKNRLAKEEAEKVKTVDDADKAKADAEKAKNAPMTAEDQLAHYTNLLLKYPPGKWTPDSPKEIERRKMVMDLMPTDEEKEFLAEFDDWSKAYATWKAGQDRAGAKSETPTNKPETTTKK